MQNTFTEYVDMADQENYTSSVKGLDLLYDLFEHLTEGGTIESFAHWSESNQEYATALLATAWLDVRRLVHTEKGD